LVDKFISKRRAICYPSNQNSIKDTLKSLFIFKNDNDAVFVFLIKMSLHFKAHQPRFHGTIMACYHYPRTPNNRIDPPIDLIPQQNNEGVLQRLSTIHSLVVDQNN
jgi:hypothetical protein